MSYKKIIASEHGDGTIFELDCGLYALCKHSRSADRAWYACHAGVFMGAYSEFIPADHLPDGICNEDIAVLETVEKLEAVNGMSRDKRRALEQLQENIKNRPDYLVWREEGLK